MSKRHKESLRESDSLDRFEQVERSKSWFKEIKIPLWSFEGRTRKGKKVLPDELNWLSYFAIYSKSHRGISIFCIFLKSLLEVHRYENWCHMSARVFAVFLITPQTYTVPFYYVGVQIWETKVELSYVAKIFMDVSIKFIANYCEKNLCLLAIGLQYFLHCSSLN